MNYDVTFSEQWTIGVTARWQCSTSVIQNTVSAVVKKQSNVIWMHKLLTECAVVKNMCIYCKGKKCRDSWLSGNRHLSNKNIFSLLKGQWNEFRNMTNHWVVQTNKCAQIGLKAGWKQRPMLQIQLLLRILDENHGCTSKMHDRIGHILGSSWPCGNQKSSSQPTEFLVRSKAWKEFSQVGQKNRSSLAEAQR